MAMSWPIQIQQQARTHWQPEPSHIYSACGKRASFAACICQLSSGNVEVRILGSTFSEFSSCQHATRKLCKDLCVRLRSIERAVNVDLHLHSCDAAIAHMLQTMPLIILHAYCSRTSYSITQTLYIYIYIYRLDMLILMDIMIAIKYLNARTESTNAKLACACALGAPDQSHLLFL